MLNVVKEGADIVNKTICVVIRAQTKWSKQNGKNQ